MKQTIKKELDKFIDEKYENLLKIASIFLNKNDNDQASELITETYISILNAKTSKGIENAIKNDNLFNFVYVAIRNQLYYYKSNYNKQKQLTIREFKSSNTQQQYTPSENEILFLKINQTLHTLYQEEKIDYYHYNLFNLTYANETIIPIKGLTNEEVIKRRKMSLRMLSKETGISVSAIFQANKATMTILKNELKEINIL